MHRVCTHPTNHPPVRQLVSNFSATIEMYREIHDREREEENCPYSTSDIIPLHWAYETKRNEIVCIVLRICLISLCTNNDINHNIHNHDNNNNNSNGNENHKHFKPRFIVRPFVIISPQHTTNVDRLAHRFFSSAFFCGCISVCACGMWFESRLSPASQIPHSLGTNCMLNPPIIDIGLSVNWSWKRVSYNNQLMPMHIGSVNRQNDGKLLE